MTRVLILFVALFCWLLPCGLKGQTTTTHEIGVQIDNDRFNFDATDRYYSNGLILTWNRTVNVDDFFLIKGIQKSIFISSLQHKIFTPSEIIFYDKQRHDRPYASTLTLTGGLKLFVSKDRVIQGDMTLGVSGPIAGGQNLQEWWHRKINVLKPRGWDSQIANSPVARLHLQFSKAWFKTKIADFLSESELNLGTLLTNVKQSGIVRIGRFLPLSLSTFSGGNLQHGPHAQRTEIYFFAGAAIEYVNYNGLIQGNRIGPESPHTRTAIPWVYHGVFGLQLSKWRVNTGISYNILSKEVSGGTSHQYVSLKLGFRF